MPVSFIELGEQAEQQAAAAREAASKNAGRVDVDVIAQEANYNGRPVAERIRTAVSTTPQPRL